MSNASIVAHADARKTEPQRHRPFRVIRGQAADPRRAELVQAWREERRRRDEQTRLDRLQYVGLVARAVWIILRKGRPLRQACRRVGLAVTTKNELAIKALCDKRGVPRRRAAPKFSESEAQFFRNRCFRAMGAIHKSRGRLTTAGACAQFGLPEKAERYVAQLCDTFGISRWRSWGRPRRIEETHTVEPLPVLVPSPASELAAQQRREETRRRYGLAPQIEIPARRANRTGTT